MFLAILTVGISTAAIERIFVERFFVSITMNHLILFGDLVKTYTAYFSRNSGKVLVDDLLRDTHSLKDLSTVITAKCTDTHLR